MAAKPLCILLCSEEHEKIQMAAMTASVAAVSDRPVRLLVSMSAILAFQRGKAAAERYHGGPFSAMFREKNVPDAIELLRQGRTLGDLGIWACPMVLDLMRWDLPDLVEDLFDGRMGLTRFLAEAEAGDLIAF